MKANMGTVDKIIRLLTAVIIIVLYYASVITGIRAIVLLAIAMVFILTSMMKFCPLYYPFGISTRRSKPAAPVKGKTD